MVLLAASGAVTMSLESTKQLALTKDFIVPMYYGFLMPDFFSFPTMYDMNDYRDRVPLGLVCWA